MAIQFLQPHANNLTVTLKTVKRECKRSHDTLEALRNALYKCSTYLLTISTPVSFWFLSWFWSFGLARPPTTV